MQARPVATPDKCRAREDKDMKERYADYENFIYQNTHMTREEAKQFAIYHWNHGFDKYEALAEARKQGR